MTATMKHSHTCLHVSYHKSQGGVGKSLESLHENSLIFNIMRSNFCSCPSLACKHFFANLALHRNLGVAPWKIRLKYGNFKVKKSLNLLLKLIYTSMPLHCNVERRKKTKLSRNSKNLIRLNLP